MTWRSSATIVRDGRGASRGRSIIIMMGRRRVGKSRLAQEFCDRSGLPYVFFPATKGRAPGAERAAFVESFVESGLPGADLIRDVIPSDWNMALRALSLALPADTPSIVVIDEVPWLIEGDPSFEGALQTVWDRYLSQSSVLLILVGSDLSTMESLSDYSRPFHGRAATMRVDPLHVADVQDLTGLDDADAIDAYLITGGFPEIVRSWPSGVGRTEFLAGSFADPLSPLLVAGELALLSEFPKPQLARSVVEVIGSGERTFSSIASAAGGDRMIPSGSLSPLLAMLARKRLVDVDKPLSIVGDSKNTRYRVADPYLRFWLALVRETMPFAERGRGDLALQRVERSWASWRGRAVEPLVRESLFRLAADEWGDVEAVGGWWNRINNPEVDLVAADRPERATAIRFVGSVKWLDGQKFDGRDRDVLARDAFAVPGVDDSTPLVAVSRSGVDDGRGLARHWGPDDLVGVWRR